MVENEFFDNFVDIPLHYLREPVKGQPDTVIGNSFLGEI